jgi:hypothetical protein
MIPLWARKNVLILDFLNDGGKSSSQTGTGTRISILHEPYPDIFQRSRSRGG